MTGTKLPAWCSFLKYWMPGSMLLSEPPFASAAAYTAEKAALAWVGLPLIATWFL